MNDVGTIAKGIVLGGVYLGLIYFLLYAVYAIIISILAWWIHRKK